MSLTAPVAENVVAKAISNVVIHVASAAWARLSADRAHPPAVPLRGRPPASGPRREGAIARLAAWVARTGFWLSVALAAFAVACACAFGYRMLVRWAERAE